MAGPWEQFQTQPPAAAGPWTRYQTPGAPPAAVDLTRQPVVDDVTWFRNTYGRDPISADQAGTNDPASFRRTFGFDPVGPQAPNGVLGEDPFAIRAQLDPEGHAAYQAQLQQGMPRTTTAGWDEQGFDTNNSPVDWLRQAGQGVFGLGDELEGALGGLGSFFRGQGFQPGYDRSVTNARGEIAEFENANPTTATLLELAGAVPTAFVPGMAAAARGATTLSRVGRGVLAGTATGGLTGFGLGEGSPAERLPSTIQGAGPGGVIGGLLPLAAPLVTRVLTGPGGIPHRAGFIPQGASAPAARTQPMTTEELRAAGQAAYRRADDAGVIVPQGELTDFYFNARRMAIREGADLDPGPGVQSNTPLSAGVLRRIDAATSSKGMLPGVTRAYDLQELSQIRTAINGAARDGRPEDRRIALMLRDEFDSWLDNLSPNQLVNGNVDEATAALREARDLWGRYRRSELLDEIQERALDNVGANYTQAGLQTALRQQFKALKNSPRFATFTLEEKAIINDIVRGAPMENTLRRLGVFAPRGAFTQMFALGGVMSGSPLMLGASALGEVARRASGAMTNSNVNSLRRAVGGGGVLPPSFGTQQTVQGLLGAGSAFLTPRLTLIPEEYLPVPAGLR